MERTLTQWLDYIQRQHPRSIDLGLDRVRAVASRLGLGRPAAEVITVAGTNGKGSTVAFIESIARSAGLRVGAYTSPHLLRYNERVRIDGDDVGDSALCEAFAAVESARSGDALTYFEFGTLAALWLFERAALDLAVLEVGLGGRLDAVNLIDPDVAVITTVDLDHQGWLGEDREAIGAEKAGILRGGKPCVLAEKDPPSSVLRRAYALGAFAIRGHSDYLIDRAVRHWVWREPGFSVDLPYPALPAPAQLDNAAAAIAALRASQLSIDELAMRDGVAKARVRGRLQVVSMAPEVVVDVAHNAQAAKQLAEWLAARPKPTRAVFSCLADKDVAGIVKPLAAFVRDWHLAAIDDAGDRGLELEVLAGRVAEALPRARLHRYGDLRSALAAARHDAGEAERVLVFGSFHTAAVALSGE